MRAFGCLRAGQLLPCRYQSWVGIGRSPFPTFDLVHGRLFSVFSLKTGEWLFCRVYVRWIAVVIAVCLAVGLQPMRHLVPLNSLRWQEREKTIKRSICRSSRITIPIEINKAISREFFLNFNFSPQWSALSFNFSQMKDVSGNHHLWTLLRRKKNKNATRIKSEKTVLHLWLFEETSLLIFHVCTSSHSFADFPKCRKEGAHCTSLVLTRRKKKFLLFVLPRRLSKGVSFRSVAVLKHWASTSTVAVARYIYLYR